MKSAFRITFVYLAVASLWILLSDRAIALFTDDVAALTAYSSAKGLFYVTVTSLMLFIMIRKEIAVRNDAIARLNRTLEVKGELIHELHHRIGNNIQVILGVLGLETREGDFSAETKDRIVHRLLAMRSVYDIVYDYEDMREISLRKVLAAYARTASRNVRVRDDFPETPLPIETMVTLLLVLDIVLEALRESGYGGTAEMSSPEDRALSLRMDGYSGDAGNFLGRNETFVRAYLRSIKGEVSLLPGEPAEIRIRYE